MIKTLKNGVRIIFEKNESIRSCTVGIWVNNGSRYETSQTNGISHFIEHMMFKGTSTKTAKDIATEVDSIGGQINAFTTKECTCYYIKALDIHLNKGVDILTDMFFNSKFENSDIDLERGVIEEEISMYEDQPEDIVLEKLLESIHKTSSLGMPILGTNQTLKNINTETIKTFIDTNYTSKGIVVSVCGSFDDQIIDKLCDVFEKMPEKDILPYQKAEYNKTFLLIDKPIEQNHICIAFDGISITDENRYALQVLNGVLGGGMSSRLFQKVREENGLCYTISSFNSGHLDCGVYSIYLALSKNTEARALSLIKEVLLDVLANGISNDELLRQREQIKANILMGLESSSARMNFQARSILFHGKVSTADEIIQRYDNVTAEDVLNIAKKIINFDNASICVVGNTENKHIYNEFLI